VSTKAHAHLVGGGIGSLPAAALMIQDGGLPGGNTSVVEAASVKGGSLDGGGDPEADDVVFRVEYSVRAAQMAHASCSEPTRKIPTVTPPTPIRFMQNSAL
jgi:oleate hydratase